MEYQPHRSMAVVPVPSVVLPGVPSPVNVKHVNLKFAFYHLCFTFTFLKICVIAGSLESAYSLIWGSHKIWGKGGGDTLDLL